MCFSRVDHGTDDEGRSGGTAVKKGVILTSIEEKVIIILLEICGRGDLRIFLITNESLKGVRIVVRRSIDRFSLSLSLYLLPFFLSRGCSISGNG